MERTAAAEDIIAFILLLAVIVLISFFIKLGSQQSNGKKKKDFFQIYVSVHISYVKFIVVYKYTTIFLSKLVFQEL